MARAIPKCCSWTGSGELAENKYSVYFFVSVWKAERFSPSLSVMVIVTFFSSSNIIRDSHFPALMSAFLSLLSFLLLLIFFS